MSLNDYSHFAMWREGFKISDEEDHSTEAGTKYYGYLNRNGEWWIMRRSTNPRQYRWITGKTGYATFFTQRESLDYEMFDETFK